ncbi:hypothetical protein AMC90_PD00958 (plasmid) [Rhizobium phaseoli]|nr:hypothetical protein AMC90_PD00958 [Rhizobium phaseoli]
MSKFERDRISRTDLFRGPIHSKVGAWTLSLPGLAGSIASVPLSLAGCLVFYDA